MSTTIDKLLQVVPTAPQPAASRESAETSSFAVLLERAREVQPAAAPAPEQASAEEPDAPSPEEDEPAEQASGGSNEHNTQRDEETSSADGPAPTEEDDEQADSEPTDSFEYTSESAEAAALAAEPLIAAAQPGAEQSTEFVGTAVDTPISTDAPAPADAASAITEELAQQSSEASPLPPEAGGAPPPPDPNALDTRPETPGEAILEQPSTEQAPTELAAEQEIQLEPSTDATPVGETTADSGAATQPGTATAPAAATGDVDTQADEVQTVQKKEDASKKTATEARTAEVADARATVAELDPASEESDRPERKEAKADPGKTGDATRSKTFERLLSERGSSTGPSTETDPIANVDRARFVSRVANAFRVAHQRDGQIQLRLSPPELGSVKITLTVQDGALAAKLETETSSARTVLLDNLPALRERLAEQQIRVEKFDVDVRQDGGQSGNASAGDTPTEDRRGGSGVSKPAPAAPAVVEEEGQEATAVSQINSDTLDVRI